MKVVAFNILDKEKTLRAQRLLKEFFIGAKDGVRTRDLDLGKVALYQLSYARARKESKHKDGPGGRQPRRAVFFPRHGAPRGGAR